MYISRKRVRYSTDEYIQCSMTFKCKLVITERGAFIMADKEELTRLKRKIVAVDKLVKNKQRLVRGTMEWALSCHVLNYFTLLY